MSYLIDEKSGKPVPIATLDELRKINEQLGYINTNLIRLNQKK